MEVLIEVKSSQTDYKDRLFKRPEQDDHEAISLQRWIQKNPNDELYLTLVDNRTLLYEDTKLLNLQTADVLCYIF